MRALRFFRPMSFFVAVGLVATACAGGTESAGPTVDTGGRNTAIIGDRGLPYSGLSSFESKIAVDQTTRAPWLGTRYGSFSRGLVTGGGMLVQTPKFSTLDPTFPRVNGEVFVASAVPGTDDFAIGGNFFGVGAKNESSNLAILGPSGLRPGFDVQPNGRVLSIAFRGDLMYIGGYFNFVTDLTSNTSGPRPGFAVINHRTGQLLPNLPMTNLPQDRAYIEKIALAPNSNLAAIVVRDNGAAPEVMTSLRIYDVTTGVITSTTIAGAPRVAMSGVGNGMAAFQSIDAGGSNPGPLKLVNIATGQTVATYAPVGLKVDSFYAGENVIRALATGGRTDVLADLNPSTLASQGAAQIPASMANPPDIVWASGSQAVFSDGRATDTSTGQTMQLISKIEGGVYAGLTTSRGLFLGGTFRTALSSDIGRLIRIPEDGSLPTLATATDGMLPLALVTTPKGLVGTDGFTVKLFAGTGAPTQIATINTANAACTYGNTDMASRGNTVVIGGCWNSITVGTETSTERIVELDVSSTPPRIVKSYHLGGTIDVRRIAVGRRTIAVVSTLQGSLLLTFDRYSGDALLSETYGGDVRDVEIVSVGTRDEVVLGGWSLSVTQFADNTFKTVNSNAMLHVGAESGTATAVNWVEGPVYSLASGIVDGADTLVIGGRTLVDGVNREVTLAYLPNFTPRSDFTFGADNFVTSVALDADRLWVSGLFRSVTFNGQAYMASGVSAIDLAAMKLFTRGSIPTTVPATVTSAAPATTVVEETLATVEQPVPAESSTTTTTTPQQEDITRPEVVALALPQTGTPASGTYNFAENAGGTRTIMVSESGTLEFSSPTGPNAARTPAISRIEPVNKGLKVTWFPVRGATKFTVTATAAGSRATCTSKGLACTVSKLNPWQAYTLSVEAVSGKSRVLSNISPKVKPVVKVGKKSSTSLVSIVPPGGKGAATWKTTAPCTVSRGKLIAPKAKASCAVTVKVGRSTRAVRVNVG